MFCCLTIHCYAPTLKTSLSTIIYFLSNGSFFLLINGDFNLKSRFKPSPVSSMTILSNIRCKFALVTIVHSVRSPLCRRLFLRRRNCNRSLRFCFWVYPLNGIVFVKYPYCINSLNAGMKKASALKTDA